MRSQTACWRCSARSAGRREPSRSPRTPFTDVQHHVEEARTRLAAFDTVQAAAHDLKSAAEHPDLNAPAGLQPSAEALRTD